MRQTLRNIVDYLSANRNTVLLSSVAVLFIFAVERYELTSSLQLIVASGVAGLLFFVLFIFNPKLWLYFSAAFVGLFVRGGTDGISAGDVVFTLTFAVMNIIWLCWMLFVKKEKIIQNAGDFLILIFFCVLLINSISIIENDVDIAKWLSVYILLANVLFYFPLRYYIKSKSDLRIVLFCFLISALVLTFEEFQYYRENSIAGAVMAYQLAFKSHMNQLVFVVSSVGALIVGISSTNRIVRYSLIFVAVATLGALLVGFARAFWLCYALSLFIALFVLRKEIKRRFIVYMMVMLIGTAGFGAVALKEKAKYFFFMVGTMLESSTKIKTDGSLRYRKFEFDGCKSEIEKHPYSGSGIESQFRFLFVTTKEPFYRSLRSPHNSYYYMAFVMGIPMAFCFHGFLLFYLLKILKFAWLSKEHYLRAYSIISIAGLSTLLITGTITSIFLQRDAAVVAALCIFLASHVEEQFKKSKELLSEAGQWQLNAQLT